MCEYYDCSICFWYNNSCVHYPIPPNPYCVKVECTAPYPPTPEPSSSKDWLVAVTAVLSLVLVIVLVILFRTAYQMHSANHQDNRSESEANIVDELEAAREESNELRREVDELIGSVQHENEEAARDEASEFVQRCGEAETAAERRVIAAAAVQAAINRQNRGIVTNHEDIRGSRADREAAAAIEAAAVAARAAEQAAQERTLSFRLSRTALLGRNEVLSRIRNATSNMNTRISRLLEEQRNRNTQHSN